MAVVSSPFRRCLQTAALVCRELGLAELSVDNRLGEDMAAVARCNPDGKPFSYLTRQQAEDAVAEHGSGVRLGPWAREESVPVAPDRIVHRVSVGIPAIFKAAASGGARSVLLMTHGDIVNTYLPELFEGIGAYRSEEAGFAVIKLAGEGGILPGRLSDNSDILALHRCVRM